MKLSKELKISLSDGKETVVFTLRHPMKKELNKFMNSRYEVGRRGKIQDNSLNARIELFDSLLIGVENLEDASGAPINPDRKDEIPDNWKSAVIFQAFEDLEIGEIEKN